MGRKGQRQRHGGYYHRATTGWTSLTIPSLLIAMLMPYYIFTTLGVDHDHSSPADGSKSTNLRGKVGMEEPHLPSVQDITADARIVLHSPEAKAPDVPVAVTPAAPAAVVTPVAPAAAVAAAAQQASAPAQQAAAPAAVSAVAPPSGGSSSEVVVGFGLSDIRPEYLAVFGSSLREVNTGCTVVLYLTQHGPEDKPGASAAVDRRLRLQQEVAAKFSMGIVVVSDPRSRWPSIDEYLKTNANTVTKVDF